MKPIAPNTRPSGNGTGRAAERAAEDEAEEEAEGRARPLRGEEGGRRDRAAHARGEQASGDDLGGHLGAEAQHHARHPLHGRIEDPLAELQALEPGARLADASIGCRPPDGAVVLPGGLGETSPVMKAAAAKTKTARTRSIGINL